MGVIDRVLPNFNISDLSVTYLVKRFIPGAQVENLVYVNSGIEVLNGTSLGCTEGQFFIVTNLFGDGTISLFGGDVYIPKPQKFNEYLVYPGIIQETSAFYSVAVEWHLFEFING